MTEASAKKHAGQPWGMWLYAVVAIGCGVAAFVYGGWMIKGNKPATDVIVTVFSILAGFLIAVMTLLGDQSMLPGSWRGAAVQSRKLKAQLVRQKWLFALYLSTLGVIFISALLAKHYPVAVTWLERTYFGMATTTFILSLKLPWTLMSIQQGRLDAVIASRRSHASKLDQN